jgi:hypothetical protein
MEEAPEPLVPPSPSLPLTPNKILQQQSLQRPGRPRKANPRTAEMSAVPTVCRGCPVPASLVPVTLREVGRAGSAGRVRACARGVRGGACSPVRAFAVNALTGGWCPHARAPAQACTHDEGKATLTSIDIPARRPRELPGHASALDEPPAQRAKRGDGDDADPAREARRVPAEGASDDGSAARAAGAAGDQGTTRRAPARLIATRTVHIPKACWSAATDPGIEMEFWQVGVPLFRWVGAPAGLFCLPAVGQCGLGGRTQNTPGGGHARLPSPRPLLKARAGHWGGHQTPGQSWLNSLLARDEARGP